MATTTLAIHAIRSGPRGTTLAVRGHRSVVGAVPQRRTSRGTWPLGRKFTLWLADRRLSLAAFAKRHGFVQQTLNSWITRGVRMPADALATIARATCLPEAYWLDETLPYPPPVDYLNSRERAAALLSTLSSDDLGWMIEICGDPHKLRQARALWTAARGDARPRGHRCMARSARGPLPRCRSDCLATPPRDKEVDDEGCHDLAPGVRCPDGNRAALARG